MGITHQTHGAASSPSYSSSLAPTPALMSVKVLAAVSLAVIMSSVMADRSPIYGPPAPVPYHNHIPVYDHKLPYDFAYGVADQYTGNDFGHTETSNGDVVRGSYHVLLPDGRKQIVTYTADHVNGFQAHVAYEPVYG